MKEYKAQDIRNIALVGHASCGKTTLGEAFLATAGVIGRIGNIAEGTTTSDYHEDERERQISMHTSVLRAEWLDTKFNLLDTPGYADFVCEAIGALRVADLALVVVHAVDGVLVGTDKIWNEATKFGLPKILTVNCADKEHADFDKVLEQIRARFGERVLPLTLPVNAGPGLDRLLDVLASEIVTYKADGTAQRSAAPASGAEAEQLQTLHQQLIEYVAESDDALMERFFEQETLSQEDLLANMREAVRKGIFIPLFCTAAGTNVGVAHLMDFLARFGPSAADRKSFPAFDLNGNDTQLDATRQDPVLYVFKTIGEAHVGEMSYFRVYSGSITAGQEFQNSNRKSSERINQILLLNGKERTPTERLNAGDIAATVKLKNTRTDDTLCGPKYQVRLPGVEYPRPNIHAALKALSKGDEEKIASGLATIHEEDPAFHYRVDPELRQTVLSGQGELHLQSIANALKHRFRVEIQLVEPKVPYRETIQTRAESKYRHKKQTGGAGQFAEVWMRIEPLPRDSGVVFTESLVGQNVDRSFVPSVEKGVKSACEEGAIAGYRVVDLKVDFYDGKMHPVDSKDIAFQIAGKAAFKEAFLAAKPRLLEPICKIEVRVPDECLGAIMSDISGRRGRVLGMESDGTYQVINALVPQKELYQYATTLRSLTGGRSLHAEEFDHYEEMPREMEQRVIEESKKAAEEE